MINKLIIISSSLLKDVDLNKYQDEDNFTFVFGENKIQMKIIFAEFISPFNLHRHQTDSTKEY